MTALNVDLARLLHRLSERLLGKEANSQLSALELSKLSTNLNYARKLLSQLETDATTIKNQVQRQRAQAELMQQRHIVRKINDTLYDLGRLDDPTVVHITESALDSNPSSQTSAPTSKNPTSGADSLEVPSHSNNPPESPVPYTISSGTPNTLRHRHKKPETAVSKPQEIAEYGHEKTLSSQRQQQDDLTESLLSMATQLKMNSMSFGESLEKEKVYLDSAAKGLDKNVENMQGAKGRMTTLESSQNVSFWYQVKVLVAIVGLAFVGLLMLMAPKLRW